MGQYSIPIYSGSRAINSHSASESSDPEATAESYESFSHGVHQDCSLQYTQLARESGGHMSDVHRRASLELIHGPNFGVVLDMVLCLLAKPLTPTKFVDHSRCYVLGHWERVPFGTLLLLRNTL